MSSILECMDNTKFLSSLYDAPPDFCDIDLQEIKLGWDGPIARLTFCLKDFPATPPEKWRDSNTVQVELSLFPLCEVNVTAFGRGNRCNLAVARLADGVLEIRLSGDSVASFKAMSVSIDKVSALRRDV